MGYEGLWVERKIPRYMYPSVVLVFPSLELVISPLAI
jgi:hypothetical protein